MDRGLQKSLSTLRLVKRPGYILPLIVLSQFAGTSLWFAVNAILPEIAASTFVDIGEITVVIQFGFISGTLIFAIFSIADRYSSAKVFFISSLMAALSNVAIIGASKNIELLYALRFVTGFFLAGIYPVGMKIAADWYEKGLGKAMGYLVGALVLGTAFPNLLRLQSFHFQSDHVLLLTSAFATLGGVLMLVWVGDGPYRKQVSKFQPSTIFKIFRSPDFRSASLGYFGHMWELYTFWSFVPVILLYYNFYHQIDASVYGWSFAIIAGGSIGCVVGGHLSQKMGSSRVAFYSLAGSGICCLLSFFMLQMPEPIFYFFMIVWGVTVIADSPQFSTLVAQTSACEHKGTALTTVTSVGFALTIFSIQISSYLLEQWERKNAVFAMLALGPALGLLSLWPLTKRKN